MKGSVNVDSVEGEWTKFWVTLPCSSKQPVLNDRSQDSIVAQPKDYSLSVNTRQKLILYVEDNAANQRLMSKLMGFRDDMQLVCVDTADKGLEFATTEKPDLILMDIQLPVKDGNQAFVELQADEETKNIPVIAVSANAMQSDIDRSISLGFKGYVTKPIEIQSLFNVIDKVLNQ